MTTISSSNRITIADPILLQRLEGFLALGVGIAAYTWLEQSWIIFALLFLVPDISMLGFARSARAGMVSYNLGHTYIAPALLALTAPLLGPIAYGLAAIWVAHIGFDRMLGFGLKLGNGFGETHLGKVGKAKH
jgi:hypothetical protein